MKLTTPGVLETKTGHRCMQCGNEDKTYFCQYTSVILQKEIIYCRRCIQLGRMDNITDYRITESVGQVSEGYYDLPFQLSEQQSYASTQIIESINQRENLLLYAVTGAGKTEMMFEGISRARKLGLNVAVISPRVDVVIEISKRIKEAFTDEDIDVLHQSSHQQFNAHFIIATVHQLFRFKSHFDVIFIDEVDAFPLSMDPQLQGAIALASKSKHSHIFMTATPPKSLLHQIQADHVIKLPVRFHRHPLPEPIFSYFKLKPTRAQYKLKNLLLKQVNAQRFTLVFFNNIELMLKAYDCYHYFFPDLICVSSEDALRFDKVEALRRGEHTIVFTTTILERGFTMAQLDVIVVNADTFEKAALVQIAGRAGRKREAPTGTVLFLHEGVSLAMIQAKRDIKQMNELGKTRGWINA
ncbi:DEAD/DEAH box helicase family protein [Staphylococcus sp. NRL 16/872]|uniref:DEAD/DEAH box helicase family protein n=1 Tax=Staphylococcus sp. NRL 16/872 TaxID=2930131 RepID=UPI001FB4C1F3|nr:MULTISPECIES: DEAD/DEAH box helicase family protein [unclassified Staphylococcus]MCJ1662648.1 DEAD/DEAH box helicase family protein [Staphylococcus sp. NRL 18/288]MCJ1668753.1 DEAD/DEAH box helicase family protein [Staphylococcus sp. NRL 19/737]WEN68968.1 DEAD/DEAH box helicase family protein [Staphylococcus sp. NRL 16/872]